MENIEEELEKKSIERDIEVQITEIEPEVVEVEPKVVEEAPVKKVKKARSEKQIAAFEKARIKRAEGIASRKKEKEDNKELKKELKKNPLPKEVVPSIEPVKEKSVSKPEREQVIQNHYYYYGVPPPVENKKKNKRSKKRPPTPPSSESESSSEEESEEELEPQQVQYQPQTPKQSNGLRPKYKFSYS
jgi:hypothetical protein